MLGLTDMNINITQNTSIVYNMLHAGRCTIYVTVTQHKYYSDQLLVLHVYHS